MNQIQREYRRRARFQGLGACEVIPRAIAEGNPFLAEILTDDAVGYAIRAARWAHLAEAIGLDHAISKPRRREEGRG